LNTEGVALRKSTADGETGNVRRRVAAVRELEERGI